MGQDFINDGIGEGQEIAVAGSITADGKADNVCVAIRQAAFGLISDLWAEGDVFKPVDSVGEINSDVRFATGAAQFKIEVIGAIFGVAVTPKAEETVTVDKA